MIKLKALVDTIAKKQPKQSSDLPEGKKHYVDKGRVYQVDEIKTTTNNHLFVTLSYGAGDWYFYKPHVEVEHLELLTRDQLKQIMPYAEDYLIDRYLEPINKTLQEFDINTKKRIAAFLAQLAHESGSLRYNEEIASGVAYEGRGDLGNVISGDGKRYKGRGLIQLTGRYNYRKYGKILGVSLEANPEMATEPLLSARIAGAYWNENGLNYYADRGQFREITRRINGGFNGLRDRYKYYNRALNVL